MGQGVATGIAVFRRVGHGSDAESINHQHNHTSNHGRTISEARRIGYVPREGELGMLNDKW
jgi:hypothetical protein